MTIEFKETENGNVIFFATLQQIKTRADVMIKLYQAASMGMYHVKLEGTREINMAVREGFLVDMTDSIRWAHPFTNFMGILNSIAGAFWASKLTRFIAEPAGTLATFSCTEERNAAMTSLGLAKIPSQTVGAFGLKIGN